MGSRFICLIVLPAILLSLSGVFQRSQPSSPSPQTAGISLPGLVAAAVFAYLTVIVIGQKFLALPR